MKQRKMHLILVLIVFISISIFFFPSCGKVKDKGQETKIIKIGAILPLTGNLAVMGEQEFKVIKIWEDKLNEQGWPIKFEVEDSRGTPKDGITALRKLLLKDVSILISSLTLIAEPLIPITSENGKINFVLSVHPNISSKANNVFRIYYGYDIEMEGIVKYCKSKRVKSIGIFYIETPEMEVAINQDLSNKLNEAGIKLIASEKFGMNGKNLKEGFEKITSTNPDLIVIEDYGFLSKNILNFAEAHNVKNKLFGGSGFLGIPQDQRALFKDIPFVGIKTEIRKKKEYFDFIKSYKDKFKTAPPIPIDAIFMYDNIGIIIQTLEKSNWKFNTQEFIKKLIEMKEYEGISGKIKILENGSSWVPYDYGKFNSDGEIIPINIEEK